jgi:Flp pilus assembly protein TadG
MIWLRKLLKNEAGQSSVLMAFIFVVLCSVAALAVDIGHMSAAKTSLQNAADSAALSGLTNCPRPLRPWARRKATPNSTAWTVRS